tara:strand:- start:1019 stop:1552 length:534 start_codon:yes stop_codon:yes gene_type:complete
MALQSSGAISLQDIQNEFGGSHPISLSEYYGVASGIPSSGQISISQFYGKSGVTTERSYTFTGSNYSSATYFIAWYDTWVGQEGYYTQWSGTKVCAGGASSGTVSMTYNAWSYIEYGSGYIARITNNVPFPQHNGTVSGWRYFSKRLDPYQSASGDDFGGHFDFYANRTTSSSYVTP